MEIKFDKIAQKHGKFTSAGYNIA